MGNSISVEPQSGGKKLSFKKGGQHNPIDFIVTYYILSMNSDDIEETQEADTCDTLTSLTTDIIKTKATKEDIIDKYNSIHKDKKPLTKYQDTMCQDVAKFYVNIAKVFGAIVKAIHPEYVYEDEFGKTIKKSIKTKSTIPFGKEFGLSKLSFCNTRINNLVERGTQDKKTCVAEMNTMENNQRLPELFDLYCDAGYECNSGRFFGNVRIHKERISKRFRFVLQDIYW